ncbi:MAG: hypothetical protein IJ622_06445, partial [Bacteroidales bacterium]|nr:hypothetical protein [Bacteroidales bacterium]
SVSGSAFARGRIPATAGLLGSLSGPAASGGRTLLCWPQTFKELSISFLLQSTLLSVRNGLQRYNLFYYWQSKKSIILYKILYNIGIQ